MFSLIIVDYCSIEKTISYIREFFLNVLNPELYHVVIVDNSPTPEIDQINGVEKKSCVTLNFHKQIDCYYDSVIDSEVIYCFSGSNLGYAKGNNLGTIIADSLYNDPYYIISNNDMSFNTPLNYKQFLYYFEKNPKLAVIGPRVIGLDGKEQSPHKKISAASRLIFYYWFSRWPFYWKPDYDYTASNKYCYRVMGCFMMISSKWFKRAGRFDENTFMFFEESILSERLNKIGGKTLFLNDWTIVHAHGDSVKKINKWIQAEQWVFDSGCYYYKEYRNTSDCLLNIAQVNFGIFKLNLFVRNIIKTIIRKINGDKRNNKITEEKKKLEKDKSA